MFGRNASSALGVQGVDAISENTPRRVLAADLGAEEGVGFVHAACGRSHSLLVDSDGQVWSAGANNFGQVSCAFGSCFCVDRLGTSVWTPGFPADSCLPSDGRAYS